MSRIPKVAPYFSRFYPRKVSPRAQIIAENIDNEFHALFVSKYREVIIANEYFAKWPVGSVVNLSRVRKDVIKLATDNWNCAIDD